MQTWNSATVMTPAEVDLIHHQALQILAEIGVYVGHPLLRELLGDLGAEVDPASATVRFPRVWTENFLAEATDEFDDDDSLEVSCTLPWGKRCGYAGGIEATAGTYPQYLLDFDGTFRPHTLATAADLTRLADALPHIDRLGVMGSPADVPPLLGPLYMRLIAWRHAGKKLSGCGEVRDVRLIPYIEEMGAIVAGAKGEPVSRYAFAEVELLSPLRFGAVEAEIFVHFWQAGLKAGIGNMPIAGASAPVTLAATLTLMLAESLFISVLYRGCYGLRKLYLQANSSGLDMRSGMFPFGRPERGLLALAMGQMARHYRAALWASAVHSDSKGVDVEAGYAASFNAVPALMAGTLGLECYGLVSGAEASSPVQLVVDNEYLGGIKRFAAGFEVNHDTLAWELIQERGIGGTFLDAEHTASHFRAEHWQPGLFSREGLNAWLEGDRKLAAERARDQAQALLAEYHPRGVDEDTERSLLRVIGEAQQDLLG
ncbi:MAG TPA: trimethylamine methyltransferase family protein [Armatimonadota bacterium]|jgi:trimethylamine--corrinoid protein Co-methyltransferase